MKVSGFDVSKAVTGWGTYDCNNWNAGTLRCPVKAPFELKKHDIDAMYTGQVCDWYRHEFLSLLAIHKPDAVGIEKPLTTMFSRTKLEVDQDAMFAGKALKRTKQDTTNFATVHLLHSVAAVLCALCARKRIPVYFIAQQSWRSSFGVGWPSKGCKDRSKHFKVEARRICDEMGISVKSNDAAEAIGITHHLMEQLNPQHTRRVNDLFSTK